ncbi:Alpha/Beta hydrolase protein [Gigaspora rosea]|uniref:carboxypeptidase C n=1 Tax=Gigaspora rosea TaxID=44941 RepID=A0A397V620_9GLOM|nr:Alpha/Beta hydrolase protein [Gigaspora rosea]
MIILTHSKFETIFLVLNLLLCHLASAQWNKILTHDAFPEHKIKLKEPHLCDKTVQQYSGYLDVNNGKHLFFWFFESRNNPKEDPVVLWINGGPGTTSLLGLYFELGPCSINSEGNGTIFNPYSWNNNSSMIFLDQPTYTGYSYGGDDVSDTLTAALDVYAFLQIFFQEFHNYAKLDFHLAGESFGGQFLPAIAFDINKYNHNHDSIRNIVHINLESILIGNGMMNPLVQFKYFPDMACNSSYGPVLNHSTCNQLRKDCKKLIKLVKKCYDLKNAIDCMNVIYYRDDKMYQPYRIAGKNFRDIRKPCNYTYSNESIACYPELKNIKKYSNREDVKTELGINSSFVFHAKNLTIYYNFGYSGSWISPSDIYISSLLESNIRVLIYAGDADYGCNWLGIDAWTKVFHWSGTEGFNKANITPWITASGNYSGEFRTFKGFTFLRIFESGHFVPHDQPVSSLDFFNRWIFKKDF